MRTAAQASSGVLTAATHRGKRKAAAMAGPGGHPEEAAVIRLLCEDAEWERQHAAKLARLRQTARPRGTNPGGVSRDAAKVAAFLAAADREFTGGRR